jgi:cytochrome c5
MNMLKSRFSKLALLVLGLAMAGSLWAQQTRDQQIAERLQAVGNVCVAGTECAPGASGATAVVAQAGNGFSVQGAYEQYCAMCHTSGMAGAPLLHDESHWSARLEEVGFDEILQNSITGINAMPPRGMCMDCSDEELAELVEYLMGDAI